MREWIQKVHTEKERVQEAVKERQGDYEQRLRKMDEERGRLEGEFNRILKEKNVEITNINASY